MKIITYNNKIYTDLDHLKSEIGEEKFREADNIYEYDVNIIDVTLVSKEN